MTRQATFGPKSPGSASLQYGMRNRRPSFEKGANFLHVAISDEFGFCPAPWVSPLQAQIRKAGPGSWLPDGTQP